MRFKGTLVLFAAALFIGSTYFFIALPYARERQIQAELSSRFFRFDAGKVEFIRIRNPRGVFDIAREQGQWRIEAPRALPVDGTVLDTVLGIIRKGRMLKLITDEPGTMDTYGLHRPAITFSLGYEGRIDELALGDMNPAGTGVYAFATGIKAVFLLDREIPKALDIGLFDLRSKALFEFDPGAVNRIRITTQGRETDLARTDREWEVLGLLGGRANQETVEKYLTDILGQRALEIYDDGPPRAAYPRSLRITLGSRGMQNEKVISVRYWGTGVREGVVAGQNDMPYSGRLPREFWTLVDQEASFFRDRALFPIREQDIGSIQVSGSGERYELTRKGGVWRLDGENVDEKAALKFIWFLRSWSAVKVLAVADNAPKGPPNWEVLVKDHANAAMASLRVYGKTGDKPAGYTRDESVELYYAVSDSLQGPCAVSSIDLKGIPGRGDFKQ